MTGAEDAWSLLCVVLDIVGVKMWIVHRNPI